MALALPSSSSLAPPPPLPFQRGKSAASFWAPHPRLGNPLSCLRHPSPVSPRQRLLLRASGSPRAARAPSPPRRAGESVSGRRLLASEAGPARSRATTARPPRPGRAHGDRTRVASRDGPAAPLALQGQPARDGRGKMSSKQLSSPAWFLSVQLLGSRLNGLT